MIGSVKIKYNLIIILIGTLLLSGIATLSAGQDNSKPLNYYLKNLPFQMEDIKEPSFPDHIVNVTEYGAIPDGHTINTQAFADAIDACVQKGGGMVVIPPGTWVTGSIKLQSNINLHIESGALLQFSSRIEDFPLLQGLGGSSKKIVVAPLIYGYDLKNVAITGGGIIDGAGEVWRPVKKEKQTNSQWKQLIASGGVVSSDGKIWWPSKEAMEGEAYLKELERTKQDRTRADYAQAREYLRPNLVQLVQCNGILIDGPTVRNSPKFHLNPMRSENIIVRNITIQTQWYAQNGDGLDISSCRNVVVYNTTVDAGDDAICIKPGKPGKDQPAGPTCENIVIADCIVYHGHGGFVIGSESYGGARNISVKNCTFIGTDVGLRFKSLRGRGGLVENVYVDGIQMRNIENEAILFDMSYSEGDPERQAREGADSKRSEGVNGSTPHFRNFFIKNIICNGASRPLLINGLPEMPVTDIQIENLYVESEKGVICLDADSVFLRNVHLKTLKGSVVSLNQCRDFVFDRMVYPQNVELFLDVEGEKTDNIQLQSIDLTVAKKGIQFGKGVKPSAVIQK